MIDNKDIVKILAGYDLDNLAIGTLGSHTSLNIFKGAKDEGFKTVCVCREKEAIIYRKFPLADEIIVIKEFGELLGEPVQEKLRKMNVVLVPHGSFTAYLSTEEMANSLRVPIFGNRQLLHWEANRKEQEEWLCQAGLRLPATVEPLTILIAWSLPSFRERKAARDIFWPIRRRLFAGSSKRWLAADCLEKAIMGKCFCRNISWA
jgi:5-formaminoimidazole-4-carboxamide-1-(beta)-D-ribofuranosyl 5'-monophosphate synthetase